MGSDIIMELAASFRLEELRVGDHIIRDHRNREVGVLQVEYLWCSLIEPSFEPHAVLAVVRFHDELRALFQPLDESGGLGTATTVELGGWQDPMLSAFEGMNIMALAEGRSLDGIGYRLLIKTQVVEARLSFSNPEGGGLGRLESALIETAGRVAEVSGDKGMEAYLAMWRGDEEDE